MKNGHTNGASAPASFASLSARITDANQKVARAEDASSIDASHLTDIKLRPENFGELGKILLKELHEAEAAIGQDPLVGYKWKMAQLSKVAQLDLVDPDMALRLVSLARARLMPDNKTETRPLLIDFEHYGQAERYAEEHLGKGIRPIALPIVFYTEGGRLGMNGLRFCVPTGEAEREAFFHIRKILQTAGSCVAVILNDECLFDLQLAAEWIVQTYPRAQVVTTGKLKNPKLFKPLDDGLYEAQTGKKKTVYRNCPIAQEVNLLLTDSPANRELAERIATLKANNAALKCDELGIDVAILRQLRMDDMPVITPQNFLAGFSGRTAVRCNWKHKDSRVDVYLLFVRRDDGAWRVLFYNKSAAEALLTSKSGRELRFTWFSGTEVPGHLATVLRKGKPVTRPEDLGLIEEDLLPQEAESSERSSEQPAA